MENSTATKELNKKVRELIRSWKFWKPILSFAVGALGGFLYYHFVGCSSGTCAITSNPYLSMIWGGFLGFFLVNSPCLNGKC
jgi:hypothetical protein